MIIRHVVEGGLPVQSAGDAGSARAVIVIQEAFGVNDHIRAVAERFADQGYYAVAPELFHRAGSPEIPYDQMPLAMEAIATISGPGLTDDLLAARAFLDDAGYDVASTGIVGYCMGGSVTFYGATLGIVGAAATFYGGGVAAGRFGLPSLLEQAPNLTAPWLGLYGDLDQGIPPEQVEQLRTAVTASGQPTEIVRYADAQHGFNCDARPAVYNAAASRDAMERTFAWFAQHLHDRP